MKTKETLKEGDTIKCIKSFWNAETQTQIKEGYIVRNITQFGIVSLSHPECWEKIKSTRELPEIPHDWKRAKYLANKPNQKQFKEGNDNLFKAYINKFSQEYKARMLQILIDDLGVKALVDKSLFEDKGWKCPNSPTGYCDYHQENGIYDDDSCKYCGQPEERK